MPRPFFLKKLFKSKSSSAPASEPPKSKKLGSHNLSALRASTKARCQTLRATFRSTSASSPGSVGVSVSEDGLDLCHILPAVDSVGTDLDLSFEHGVDYKSGDHPPLTEDSHGGSAVISKLRQPSLLIPLADGPQIQAPPATEPPRVENRNSIFITSDDRDDSEISPPHSSSFIPARMV